jgi:hypothetical protein
VALTRRRVLKAIPYRSSCTQDERASHEDRLRDSPAGPATPLMHSRREESRRVTTIIPEQRIAVGCHRRELEVILASAPAGAVAVVACTIPVGCQKSALPVNCSDAWGWRRLRIIIRRPRPVRPDPHQPLDPDHPEPAAQPPPAHTPARHPAHPPPRRIPPAAPHPGPAARDRTPADKTPGCPARPARAGDWSSIAQRVRASRCLRPAQVLRPLAVMTMRWWR